MSHVENTADDDPVHLRGLTEAQRELGFDGDLARKIGELDVEPGHDALRSILAEAFPDHSPELVLEATEDDRYRSGRVLDVAGREVAPSVRAFIDDPVRQAGRSWQARCDALLGSDLQRTTFRILPLVWIARVGIGVAEFLQLTIGCEAEYPAEAPSRLSSRLSDRSRVLDLLEACPPEEGSARIGRQRYRLRQVEHVGAFAARHALRHRQQSADRRDEVRGEQVAAVDLETGVSNLIDWTRAFGYPTGAGPSPLERWFNDWSRSSAGRSGARPERHWVFEMREGVYRGRHFSEAVPRWVTRRELPIASEASLSSDTEVFAWLDDFDRIAGHPFAWYFFMLHGNRIESAIGQRVALALEAGREVLASPDRQVLHEWALEPYGF